MADLWSLPSSPSPDSDDSAAVEDIISQAVDLSALEQIAALNSSLVSDSVLPTDIEARFRKLKSFPGASHIPNNPSNPKVTKPKIIPHQTPGAGSAVEDTTTQSFSDELLKPDLLLSLSGSSSSSSPSREIEASVPYKLKNSVKNLNDPKSTRGSGSFSSPPPISSNSSSKGAASHSPPKQTCCFWCSPKKAVSSRKKSKDSEMGGSDLSSFSLKDHQRKMEKMLKEQEEMISREAEKVLKWAKQASAKQL